MKERSKIMKKKTLNILKRALVILLALAMVSTTILYAFV
jgi:uncharacterized protein YpmS